MKQKFLRTEFIDADGNVVPQLSQDPCAPELVMSAMAFLTPGCSLHVSYYEKDVELAQRPV